MTSKDQQEWQAALAAADTNRQELVEEWSQAKERYRASFAGGLNNQRPVAKRPKNGAEMHH